MYFFRKKAEKKPFFLEKILTLSPLILLFISILNTKIGLIGSEIEAISFKKISNENAINIINYLYSHCSLATLTGIIFFSYCSCLLIDNQLWETFFGNKEVSKENSILIFFVHSFTGLLILIDHLINQKFNEAIESFWIFYMAILCFFIVYSFFFVIKNRNYKII